MTYHGLSEKERLKEYAKEPEKHRYKSFINCLKDEDCRECPQEPYCKIITYKKRMGYERDGIGNWIKPNKVSKGKKRFLFLTLGIIFFLFYPLLSDT